MTSFNTKREVIDYLVSDCEMIAHSEGRWFCQEGRYELRHGEYDRPDFQPRRYRDGWGVHRELYYFDGTFNAPCSGRVKIDILDDADGFGRTICVEAFV